MDLNVQLVAMDRLIVELEGKTNRQKDKASRLFLRTGGFKVILEAMDRFQSSKDLQILGIRFFGSLARAGDPNGERDEADGADNDVIESTKAWLKQLGDEDAVRVLARAMRSCRDNVNVQATGCFILWSFLNTRPLKRADRVTCEILITALETQEAALLSEDIQERCFNILQMLLSGGTFPHIQTRALKVAWTSLGIHHHSAPVQLCGWRFLSTIASGWAAVSRLGHSRVMMLLGEAIQTHREDAAFILIVAPILEDWTRQELRRTDGTPTVDWLTKIGEITAGSALAAKSIAPATSKGLARLSAEAYSMALQGIPTEAGSLERAPVLNSYLRSQKDAKDGKSDASELDIKVSVGWLNFGKDLLSYGFGDAAVIALTQAVQLEDSADRLVVAKQYMSRALKQMATAWEPSKPVSKDLLVSNDPPVNEEPQVHEEI